nr:MAG TPA: hypothetical protein [Caudoviricetes sp.]
MGLPVLWLGGYFKQGTLILGANNVGAFSFISLLIHYLFI